MEFLYIRDCSLGIINDQTFNECGNLRTLDASYNNIIHISETALRNCTKLEKIDMTGNPVDYVSNDLYILDPSLKEIFFNRIDDFTLNWDVKWTLNDLFFNFQLQMRPIVASDEENIRFCF